MNPGLASEGSGIVGRHADEIEKIRVGGNRHAVAGSYNGRRATQGRNAADFPTRKDIGKVDLSAVGGKCVDNFGDWVVGELQRLSASGEHDKDLIRAVGGRGENHGMAVMGKSSSFSDFIP